MSRSTSLRSIPRASRTVPFVAKAIGAPIAKIAARVMAGEMLADLPVRSTGTSPMSRSRKPSSLSPASLASIQSCRLKCARPVKSWASTADFATAFAKAQLGAGRCACPTPAVRSSRSRRSDKDRASLPAAKRQLVESWLDDRRHRRHRPFP